MAAKLRREAKRSEQTISSVRELRAFFKACDLRETGREPDWQEHRQVIEASGTPLALVSG
jgi:hypothetical protein